MATFRFTETMTTYAHIDIEAETREEAVAIYSEVADGNNDDLEYTYDTDFDSAVLNEVEEIR